jgi:hypothetical protein
MRGIQRALTSADFLRAWSNASLPQRKILADLIDRLDKDGVTTWITHNTDSDFGEMSTRRLRRMARSKGVINFCRMTKEQLLRILQETNNVPK